MLRAALEMPGLVRTVTVYEPSLSSILPNTLQSGPIRFRNETEWAWLLPPSRGMLKGLFPRHQEVSP